MTPCQNPVGTGGLARLGRAKLGSGSVTVAEAR